MDTNLIAYETMLAAQETAKWTYWMMFATWFAGAATFSAVVLTLYISNRKPIPELAITSSVSIISPRPGIAKQGYGITIANTGQFSVFISSIQWECAGKKKFVQFFDDAYSSPLPKKLEHGESAFFFFEIDDFSSWVREMYTNIRNADGKIDKLKIVTHLSTGYQISQRAERSLIAALKAENS